MSQEHPHFLFSVDQITQSPDWNPRYENGLWQPPRPLRSNVRINSPTAGKVFEYDGVNVQRVPPPTAGWQEFRTYSFYYTHGKIYIYPEDATQNKVGDGSGNSHRASPTQSDAETSDDSDEPDLEDTRLRDWRSLTFAFPANDDPRFMSHACFLGGFQCIGVTRDEQQHLHAIEQLLPDEYFRNTRRLDASATYGGILCGGLVGQLPILIALIAYSVLPEYVENALTICLRHTYFPHGGQRGAGWIDRRGILVRVFRAEDRPGRRSTVSSQETLQQFELGMLSGYGNFVV